MELTISLAALSLLVLAGLASATYAKGEGASSLLAAVIGVGAAILIYLVATR